MTDTAVFPSTATAFQDSVIKVRPEILKRTAELRKFGLLLAALFLVFGEGLPLLRHHLHPQWPWFVSVGLAAVAIGRPLFLSPLQTSWMKLGHVMGAINTRVLLGILFFVAIVPIAFLLRRLGLDKMNRAYLPRQKTYRVNRDLPAERRQLERTF